MLSYHTNLIKLTALGLLMQSNKVGATEDNNRTFARVSPNELFLYLTSLVCVVLVPLTEANNQNLARGFLTQISFFSPPGSLQNQNQLLLVLQKIKAMPEGGQQLNSKNDTDQGRVLVRRQVLDTVLNRTPLQGYRRFILE